MSHLGLLSHLFNILSASKSHTFPLEIPEIQRLDKAQFIGHLTDDFFTYPYTLTSLTLTNLRCSCPTALVTLLFEHPVIEVLHLDIITHNGYFSTPSCLPQGCLPPLREEKASKER